MNTSPEYFRQQYREKYIGSHYHGWWHFSFTVTVSSVIAVLCFQQLDNVGGLEWLTIPLTFLYANFSEYFGHRGPMHHKRKGLGQVYERHTNQHHVFFNHEHMEFDSSRDFKAVLFPPILIVFFLAAFGTPMAMLLAWLFNSNVAYLFALTGILYFLNYELLHFAHHLPPDNPIARLPFMKALRQHHTYHHDPRLMGKYNFNITYPVADWVMGTYYSEKNDKAT
ncbi:hypothetical protein KIH87_02790 [Paraneptunicella aestuarii]|uniref:hypothetical protein n=1 Tax=Paraneptunicella aestuarii TaxID=2831148 RepID=UPI001E56CF5B|nr:hypothetical protein [Paraneptunicella aestuarii]UAA39308.1 hypothetical protein KIH87_02790 [Paraneptunicella aestuarii]